MSELNSIKFQAGPRSKQLLQEARGHYLPKGLAPQETDPQDAYFASCKAFQDLEQYGSDDEKLVVKTTGDLLNTGLGPQLANSLARATVCELADMNPAHRPTLGQALADVGREPFIMAPYEGEFQQDKITRIGAKFLGQIANHAANEEERCIARTVLEASRAWPAEEYNIIGQGLITLSDRQSRPIEVDLAEISNHLGEGPHQGVILRDIALNASDPVNREIARQMYVTHQLSSPDISALP